MGLHCWRWSFLSRLKEHTRQLKDYYKFTLVAFFNFLKQTKTRHFFLRKSETANLQQQIRLIIGWKILTFYEQTWAWASTWPKHFSFQDLAFCGVTSITRVFSTIYFFHPLSFTCVRHIPDDFNLLAFYFSAELHCTPCLLREEI